MPTFNYFGRTLAPKPRILFGSMFFLRDRVAGRRNNNETWTAKSIHFNQHAFGGKFGWKMAFFLDILALFCLNVRKAFVEWEGADFSVGGC